MKLLRSKLLLLLSLFSWQFSFSQYILNGNARQVSCNCYTLTPDTVFVSGSVWNSNKINLNTPFDFTFNIFLGCHDGSGADGMVFMLQPLSTNLGASGEGMGFEGVVPSIGITLDTYMNSNRNDPVFDHIAIQANGSSTHTAADLAAPVPISAVSDNVEDCQWHTLRINWDPATKLLKTYFDGVFRLQVQQDIVTTIFNNDPMVYWGFSAATGGSTNLQQFCTALNPVIVTSLAVDTACVNTPIQFTSGSQSFAPITNYTWNFGDGTQNSSMNPPAHTYAQPGIYPVNLRIRGMDGCENDTTKNIVIAAVPVANFNVYDTCQLKTPRVQLNSQLPAVNYSWSVDGSAVGTGVSPSLNNISIGTHQLQLVASSAYGCGAPDVANASFTIKPFPRIDALVEDGCIRVPVHFTGQQLDASTVISQWNWSLGDHSASHQQDPVHAYNSVGQFDVVVFANAVNGCSSDTILKTITINQALAFAGNDTTIIRDLPFQLHGQGNSNQFQWSPLIGLSNGTIPDPVVLLSDKQDYVLTVTTVEGCMAKDTIHIKAITGPTVYVPTAFSPNGDGLNDVLHAVYVGMIRVEKFAVYNRWGEEVFSTSDMKKGWDGSVKGQLSASGTYVWFARAENYLHQVITVKGTVTLIR